MWTCLKSVLCTKAMMKIFQQVLNKALYFRANNANSLNFEVFVSIFFISTVSDLPFYGIILGSVQNFRLSFSFTI